MTLVDIACADSAIVEPDVRLLARDYVFDPRPRLPFRMVARRYWTEVPRSDTEDRAQDRARRGARQESMLALLLVHGPGGHKEHWTPTLTRLFSRQRSGAGRLREVWALDLPNHGDSAVVNEEVLRTGCQVSWEASARLIHAFLAGAGTGVDVDVSRRRWALVGHSAGASVLILASTYTPSLNIASLHLLEPLVIGPSSWAWISRFVERAATREPVEVWPSVEAAYQALRVRRTFFRWDERILEIFVKYGLRPLPTAERPNEAGGVALKCTRRQQAVSYGDLASFILVFRSFARVLNTIPTHIAYGAIPDTIPYALRQEALHVASGGISNFASATRVLGAGHMMVQTHPDAVGDVVWQQLSQSHPNSLVTNGTIAGRL